MMKNEIRQAAPLAPELEDKTFAMQGEAFELLQKGHQDEAVHKIKEAWDLLPEPKFNTSCSDTILCQLITTLTQAGRHQEARPILNEWIEDLQSCGYKIFDTTPFILSGENYLYAGELREAKEQFYKAVTYGATKRDFSDRPSFYFDIAKKKITDDQEISRLFETEITSNSKPTVAQDDLSDDVIDRIEVLSEKGSDHFDDTNYDEAINIWQQALALVPQPQHVYAESQWLETSIGDAYFLMAKYKKALACFHNAIKNIEENGYENPFIMLRMGQSLLENNHPEAAKEYLMRAYAFEGEEIFENENEKYIDFLGQNIPLR